MAGSGDLMNVARILGFVKKLSLENFQRTEATSGAAIAQGPGLDSKLRSSAAHGSA